MSELRLSPDLFIGSQELNRFQKLMTEKFDLLMMYQTYSYGVLRDGNNQTADSLNFKLELNNTLGTDGKVKLSQKSYALDAMNRLITKDAQSDIAIPEDSKWYWVKIKYAYTPKEVGKVSISANGSLIGTETKFTEVMRGLPDFPNSVKFIGSVNGNDYEYKVASVIDDNNAVLSGTFSSEQNLSYYIIGTFTPGSQQLEINKPIYRYDSCIDFSPTSGFLVLEDPQGDEETPVIPTTVGGYEFLIARVKNESGAITIQDKRTKFYTNRFE